MFQSQRKQNVIPMKMDDLTVWWIVWQALIYTVSELCMFACNGFRVNKL